MEYFTKLYTHINIFLYKNVIASNIPSIQQKAKPTNRDNSKYQQFTHNHLNQNVILKS